MVGPRDAHCHFQDARLDGQRPAFLAALRHADARAVVNGTRETDWEAVRALATAETWIIPSYGLHPWWVGERSPSWRTQLEGLLNADPRAMIGEVGLDRWKKGYDRDDQLAVLLEELLLATRLDRAVTIHCLEAWGPLEELTRDAPLPARGFLIHAYGGSADLVPVFAERGAYFSFSPHFLLERKAAQRAAFAAMPADRLLVETDAPDLAPPPERNAHPLASPDGRVLNSPLNITVALSGLAAVRGVQEPALRAQIAENFARLFGT